MGANTKAVGWIGVATFLVALLSYGPFQTALNKAVPFQYANLVSLILLVVGFAGAYYGMPYTVPKGPSQ